MTTPKKDSERFAIMVPRECESDIEYIMSQTNIKSKGELIRLMLTRYRHDFVNAYNQFFSPSSIQPVQTTSTTTEPTQKSKGIRLLENLKTKG